MPARIKLADYIERKNDAGAIIIELPDGTDVTMPPAELWSDEAHAAALAGDLARSIPLILGEQQYERFVAAGGNWRVLNGIVTEQQGLDMGESGASSKSSASSATPSNPTSSATTTSTSRKRSAPKS